MRGLLGLLALILGGCAVTPPPVAYRVEGEVRMAQPLPRLARIEVTVLSRVDGQPREVQRLRYETGALPLSFSTRLSPVQWGSGDLFLRAYLYFVGMPAVQAGAREKIMGKNKVMLMMLPRRCFPNCQ